MKKREAQILADECFEPMARAMGMWNEDRLRCYVYKKCKHKEWAMSNVLNTWYERVTINVFAHHIEDREDFLQFMRHELLHITQLGFVGISQTIAQLASGKKMWNAFDQQWRRDFENDMIRLENMMDSLGMTGKRILAIGKKMMREL